MLLLRNGRYYLTHAFDSHIFEQKPTLPKVTYVSKFCVRYLFNLFLQKKTFCELIKLETAFLPSALAPVNHI